MRLPVPLALALAFATGGCDLDHALTTPEYPSAIAAPTLPPQAHTPWSTDDEFARAARAEAPGFAGFYLRDDGAPVVLVTDPRHRGQAQRYLAALLAESRKGRHADAPPVPVFRTVDHDFARLKEWFDALDPLFTREDVYLMDVDEVNNRLHVGVRDEAAVRVVQAEAARTGIPAGALHVVIQPRPQTRQTVQDWTGTLMGGYQLQFSPHWEDVCSIGFTAIYNNWFTYVTNSHCTTSYLANDGGTHMQPTWVAGNEVGAESRDRGLYACNGWFTSCRRSDAAYVTRNTNRSPGLVNGYIAKTSWGHGGPGGLTITGTYSIIRRYAGSTPVGTWLDKTGRSTGSTYGQVTQSCVSIGSFRCQDVSTVYSQRGDSGSPMYVWLGNDQVELQGILWGGPDGDWNTTYSSRLAGIEQDLGSLSGLCAPGYSC